MNRYSRTRVYSQKTYSNPFFQRRRNRRISRIPLKIKLLWAFLILAIVGLFWFLFYHQYFLIDNIVIKGAETIQEHKVYELVNRQLPKKRFFILNQNNLFSFSKRQAKNEVLKKYYVENLKINKQLPRTIVVSFKEKTATAIWLEDDIYYYIDNDFNIISKVETLEINTDNYTVLTNAIKESSIADNGVTKKIKIGEEYLNFALQLAQKIKNTAIPNNGILAINKAESTINLNISNGPVIYFNVNNDLEKQFKFLTTLFEETIKGEENLKKLQYIDLRFGDKIYYK